MRTLFGVMVIGGVVAASASVCSGMRFGILADTRSGELPSSGWNPTGVNTGAVRAIAKAMVADGVDLVVAGGDLIHGQYFPFDFTPFPDMYTGWTNALAPVYSAGIPVYAIPGNHEYYRGTFTVHTNEVGPLPMEAWSNFFRELPRNGPSGEVGRTYSFAFSNAFFIGLDQYRVENDVSYLLNTNFTYSIHNQWIAEQLASNTLRHVFVLGHFPAFTIVSELEELCDGGSLAMGGLGKRQTFWDQIAASGCRVYFGAHQHFYARASASISNGPTMQHVIIGNSGAPHEKWDGSYDENGKHGVTLVPEYHEAHKGTHGYILVDVEGLTVRVMYRSSDDLATWTNRDEYVYTLVPLAPEPLAPSGISADSFRAHWRPSVGARSYLLDVSSSNDFAIYASGYHNCDVQGTEQVVTGLVDGTRYYYRLRAVDAGGTSDYSCIATVWTEPTVPHALPASEETTNGFMARWLSASGATNYLLYVATDRAFTAAVPGYDPASTGPTTEHVTAGLEAGKQYYYRLRAENAGGTSTNSHAVSVWTVPEAPAVLEATNVTDASFLARWDASQGTTNYRLDVSVTQSFESFVIGNLGVGTSLVWDVVRLQPEETYYYRVRATNPGGVSENSRAMKVVLIPEPAAAGAAIFLLALIVRRTE